MLQAACKNSLLAVRRGSYGEEATEAPTGNRLHRTACRIPVHISRVSCESVESQRCVKRECAPPHPLWRHGGACIAPYAMRPLCMRIGLRLTRSGRHICPITTRTITTMTTIPIVPVGAYPHDRLCGQEGNAPMRSRIKTIRRMVPNITPPWTCVIHFAGQYRRCAWPLIRNTRANSLDAGKIVTL